MHRMSGDFYIYLCSTVAGVAAVVQAYFAYRQNRRNMIADTSQKQIADSIKVVAPGKKASRTAKLDGIVISPARLAVITVLLLVTTGLSVAGLVSSIQRKEELNISLRSENVETTVRQWLAAWGYGVTAVDDPTSSFSLLANLPSGKHIAIFHEKAFGRYLAVGASVTIGPSHQALIAKLPDNEKGHFFEDLSIELYRFGGDTVSMSDQQMIFIKRIPITNALTEDTLIKTINSVEAFQALMIQTVSRKLE